MDAYEQQLATPPLAPELWNFCVIVIICGLLGWMMRLMQRFLTFVDVRFAVQSDAVRALICSLHHFGQLFNTVHSLCHIDPALEGSGTQVRNSSLRLLYSDY